ncbi:MAG: hypothetical protein UDG86_14870 [Lachnospiraceae bacterium]|jgi:hypothetical protein|nr:hypothetical protein [Lachnospiraceae bacterium]
MKSIIEELYNGDLYPGERYKSIHRRYYQNKEEAFRGYEAFSKKLDEERAEEFKAIMDRHLEVLTLEMEKNFSDGFRLGVRLMCEVFMQEGR